jgi:hypothetical protein
MNITPNERDSAIETILSKGLTKPMPTWAFLWDMWRKLGFRVIFWETSAALLISCAVAVMYIALIMYAVIPLEAARNIHAMLFLFSPAVFICLTLCTEAIERTGGLYEIKMTSKYTIRQITAFRLLCFSLLGMVFTVLGSAAISAVWGTMHFMKVFLLGLCSLFLCSLLIIYVMRCMRGGWYKGAIIWTAAGVLPLLFFREAWENLLSGLPIAITLGVTAVACVLFAREIKITTKGVLCYVDC